MSWSVQAPGEICQILCLTTEGREPSGCRKKAPHVDLAQRIQARFDHIRAVRSDDNEKLREVNAMYRWLFPRDAFDSARFQGALSTSRKRDWMCCDGVIADQNTALGRRTASGAWGLTEDYLTSFFGPGVTGNTWREIGTFAKKASEWERAKPALFAAQQQRLNTDSPRSRLSLTKTWAPYDMKTALSIYERNSQTLARTDLETAHDDDFSDVHADDGLEAAGDANSIGARESLRSTAGASPSGDTIVVSSRSLTDEPSSTHMDRSGKRRHSLGPAAEHPAPKRRTADRSDAGSGNAIAPKTLEDLVSGQEITSAVVYATLRIVECAVGSRLSVVEPDTPQAFAEFAGDPETRRLIPLCHHGHWVLAVMSANQNILRVYDPQPSPDSRQAIKGRIAASSASSPLPKIRFTAPLLQEAEEDSGLLLLVSAFYVSLDLQVPQDVDPILWREMVRVLLMPLSGDEVRIVQTHVLGQPLGVAGSPEKVTLPGGSINIGELPTSLTPTDALDLLNRLRSEAIATYQRVEAATSSMSSALEVVATLEDRTRARCQREIGGIGIDVVESLVRLNRLKQTYQHAYACAETAQAALSSVLSRLAITE